jgi:hypothetical protein
MILDPTRSNGIWAFSPDIPTSVAVKANPEKSDRQIAKTVKVSPTTVGTVRTKMEAKGDVSKLDTREDTKGRRQPARKEKQPDEQPAVIRNPPKTENKKEERALRRSDIEPAAISEVAYKIIRAVGYRMTRCS